jgi:hypothetical protein
MWRRTGRESMAVERFFTPQEIRELLELAQTLAA